MARIILTTVIIGATMTPALALQTEVDPQTMHFKRIGKVKWDERQQRERERAAERAKVAERTDEAVPRTSGGTPPASPPTGGIAGIIYDIFGPNGGAAVSVASCESGLNPRAVNSSTGAAGLFQLMPVHWQGKFDPFDPVANTRYAYGLSSGGTNWSAWAGVCQP